ncbi:MAG TPA: hypothetical protein P5202_00265 [Methanomassiliicoccales archaeon]|nr:hypothetical protein [Methanomassiliicoccales archaeon]
MVLDPIDIDLLSGYGQQAGVSGRFDGHIGGFHRAEDPHDPAHWPLSVVEHRIFELGSEGSAHHQFTFHGHFLYVPKKLHDEPYTPILTGVEKDDNKFTI